MCELLPSHGWRANYYTEPHTRRIMSLHQWIALFFFTIFFDICVKMCLGCRESFLTMHKSCLLEFLNCMMYMEILISEITKFIVVILSSLEITKIAFSVWMAKIPPKGLQLGSMLFGLATKELIFFNLCWFCITFRYKLAINSQVRSPDVRLTLLLRFMIY